MEADGKTVTVGAIEKHKKKDGIHDAKSLQIPKEQLRDFTDARPLKRP